MIKLLKDGKGLEKSNIFLKESISKLIEGKDLTLQETTDVMDEIMSGNATDAQIAAFLVALRLKGETIDEIAACAKVMREKASRIKPKKQKLPELDLQMAQMISIKLYQVKWWH